MPFLLQSVAADPQIVRHRRAGEFTFVSVRQHCTERQATVGGETLHIVERERQDFSEVSVLGRWRQPEPPVTDGDFDLFSALAERRAWAGGRRRCSNSVACRW